jgi:conjugative transfer region lipoprotein (TIGR03751 family)
MSKLTTLFSSIVCGGIVIGITGCSTTVPDPQAGAPTMAQSYQGAMNDNPYVSNSDMEHQGSHSNYKKAKKVTLPTLVGAMQNPNLMVQQALDNRDFPMLPNPQVMIYITPHFQNGLPIHGNWSTFSLYETNHYALPSEIATGSNVTQ